MVFFEREKCRRFWFELNKEICVYLMVQPTEAFDILVEREKAMEETLIEPPRLVTIKTGKRGFDQSKLTRRPGKRG